jgi:hypothetical protein
MQWIKSSHRRLKEVTICERSEDKRLSQISSSIVIPRHITLLRPIIIFR